MSADSTVVAGPALLEPVSRIVAEVLMVPRGSVTPSSALVADLGAESIDFLDLVFRVEELLGRKIPISRWEEFTIARFTGVDLARAITTAVVVEFAELERDRPAT